MSDSVEGPAIRLRDVVKDYDDDGLNVRAVDGVTVDIGRRAFTMIVGPSGSGKTTLLNLMGCIDRATSGAVEIAGRDVASLSDNALSDFRARHIGFVFQNFSLIPVLSARENVAYPLELIGMPGRERGWRVDRVLERVGLADVADHRPNQLSGGQRQRVAIARALVKEPTVVFADEPTANLDSRTGAEIVALMREIQSERETTFVFSTHDPNLMAHARETVVIRDGRLVEHRIEEAA